MENLMEKRLSIFVIVVVCMISHGSSADTLFDYREPITQFIGLNNFTRTVVGSKYAWIIDFYSSWCGHCQNFAPVWVDLARNIKGWHAVVRVGAVACSDPRNNVLCRNYSVWAYPTVKFFPSNTIARNKGYNFNSGRKTMEDLRTAVIDYLNEQTARESGIPLRPVRSIGEARALKQPATRALFLVATEDNLLGKRMAKGTILDMSSRYPEIVVVWSNSNLLRSYNNIAPYPSVHRITDTGITRVSGKGEFVAIITQHYDRRDVETTTARSTTVTTVTTYTPSSTTPLYVPSDGVHSQDLDSSVYYSFWIEVAAQRRIGRKALRALKRHVYIMAKYHTGSEHVVRFLRRVHNWLANVKAPLSGSDWVANITALQRRNAYVPQKIEWTGCNGSLQRYRGYPCSLWVTFHSLTVNAYIQSKRKARRGRFNPKSVLITTREYIRHFMGCRSCANHFTSGMAANIEREVKKPMDAVLFLWRIHNDVNQRLHGDTTEDPNHPKVQFPAVSVCSNCRQTGAGRFNANVTWNEQQVFNYLLEFYKPANVIRDSGESAFQNDRPVSRPLAIQDSNNCQVNNTDWSKCSKSCGTGVSSRISNDNTECKPKLQFRLCVLRPCKAKVATGQPMPDACDQNKMTTTFKGLSKTRLVYGSCRSIKKYTWRYCGNCPDKCCRPTKQNTISIAMECKHNKSWYQSTANVLKIEYCRCDDKC